MKTENTGRGHLINRLTNQLTVATTLLFFAGISIAFAARAPLYVILMIVAVMAIVGCACVLFRRLKMSDIWYVPPGSALVKDKKILHRFEEEREYWSKQLRALLARWPKGTRLYSPNPFRVVIKMHVRPITTNPKVRDISYSILGVAAQTAEEQLALDEFLSRPEWESRGLKNLTDVLEFLCYEFNEEKSRELGEFFNPKEPQQRRRFRELVIGFLEKKLGKPLPFSPQFISFSV